jgi:peptide/nickel transport system substrate-binding protein
MIAVGVAAVLALAGTTGVATAQSPKPVLTIGINIDFGSLNPAVSGAGPEQIVRALFDAPLIHLSPSGVYEAGGPALTASYSYLGTGNKNFEMTLRHNARFSDGTLVTAQAVKTWLTWFPAQHGIFADDLGTVLSIQTIGEWTLVIHLAQSNPNIPWLFSEEQDWGAVSSPTSLSPATFLDTHSDGAGPYVLVPSQSVVGDHYTLVPNKYYWNQSAIRFSKVIARVIAQPSTMLAAARTGQLDVAVGDVTTADAAKAAGLKVQYEPLLNIVWFILDRGGKTIPALGNVDVRQAINYAINRPLLAKSIYGGYSSPTSQIVTSDGYDASFQSHYYYDPTKAKQLLAAGGYPKGFSFSLLGADNATEALLNQAIAQELSGVGITVKIITSPTENFFNTNAGSGTYPALQNDIGIVPISLPYNTVLGPKAAIQPFHADDPLLDQLYQQAAVASTNTQVRWGRVVQRIATQGEIDAIITGDFIIYVSKGIGGTEWGTTGFMPFATNWYPV